MVSLAELKLRPQPVSEQENGTSEEWEEKREEEFGRGISSLIATHPTYTAECVGKKQM